MRLAQKTITKNSINTAARRELAGEFDDGETAEVLRVVG
jgi:hypothetical protein